MRGAAHGPDIGVQLEMGQTLLIAPERGYAVIGADDGELRMLAAFDDDGARELLRAALALAGDREASVSWLTAKQQWAIEVCRRRRAGAAGQRRRGVRRRRRRAVHARTSRAAPSCEPEHKTRGPVCALAIIDTMSKTPRSLSGKVAVVTGGARGIGQALARALAREGVVVAIGDLDASAAEAAAAELGNGSIGLALDVTDRPGFTAFLDEVEQRLGPIDILVNNAGIMMVTPLDEEDDASISRQLEINLRAVIHGTQEAMRRMKPRGTGHIVNIASLAGRAAAPGLATYVATKHAVIGLSESVRAELRGTGVEITVVMPGFAKTELASGVPDLRVVKRVTPEEIADATVDAIKVPRFDVWAPKRLAGDHLARRDHAAHAGARRSRGR